ncbi:MAG TPA: alpha/beta hydrolase [Burkholderiales bacterium]|nr:alpha/beta hydrolase [Burkholderiales bacterium]
MQADPEKILPPSRELLLLEARSILEFGAFFALLPWLRTAPRGDGHPVLVLPGLLASDVSTLPLRTFLANCRYSVHGWEQGTNLGPREGVEERMLGRLRELRQRYNRKVSLVGWSLGGSYARRLARKAPEDVRLVISLGSPFTGNPRASNVWRLFELVSGKEVEDLSRQTAALPALTVPVTSIYSRSDGIVAWQNCIEQEGPLAENIEVEGSHSGLGHNAAALYAVADRLAQREGEWRPFDRASAPAPMYPDPHRDGESAKTTHERSRT